MTQQLKTVLDEMLRQKTEYDGLDDMDDFESVQIENDPFMTLYITCEYQNEYTIAHYRNDDARKSDPMIRADLKAGELKPRFMEYQGPMKKEYTEDIEYIEQFMDDTWASNLQSQHL